MPRQPKPFFRKHTSSWYGSITGRQIPLGRDRELADEKFRKLMADRGPSVPRSSPSTNLSQRYLARTVEEGGLRQTPLPKVRKPRRNSVYTAEQWQQIKSKTTEPFIDFLDFS